MDKRLRWFDEGAPMLRLVLGRLGRGVLLPPTGDYYACPCCLTAHPREAVEARYLTEEHVPPRKLGGRGLLLTCDPCNSNSGRDFDAHAIRKVELDNFVLGRGNERALPATFVADGIPLRGTAQRTEDGGIQLFGVPDQNNPATQAAHFRALDAYAESSDPNPNFSFTVNVRFDEARARVSWVRAAYLAAFAALGWCYTLRKSDVMRPIREQLAQPDAEILPRLSLYDAGAPATGRRVLLVDALFNRTPNADVIVTPDADLAGNPAPSASRASAS